MVREAVMENEREAVSEESGRRVVTSSGHNHRLFRDGRVATLKEMGYTAEEVVRTVERDLVVPRGDLAGFLRTCGFSEAEAIEAMSVVLDARPV